MQKNWVQWTIAVCITLASASWQRATGPTYPVRGQVTLGGQTIPIELQRTHGGQGDQPVLVQVADDEVSGRVMWRFYPVVHANWNVVHMRRTGNALQGALPHQPPAGKLEYQVHLVRGSETALFPPAAAITRFKGPVRPAILVPHVVLMFLGMLWSTRAGLASLFGGPIHRSTFAALLLLVVGGFVLGPAVQKQAFGAWWTGVPYGYDLTDNKMLIAGAAWIAAGICAVVADPRGRAMRSSVLTAALLTLVVFAIPHSVWGSQLAR